MKKLGDFLEKFGAMVRDGAETKKIIADAMAYAGIKGVSMEHISIHGTVVSTHATQLQRTELFLKQDKILAELKKNPLTEKITKIR